jgi:hypothetical protein
MNTSTNTLRFSYGSGYVMGTAIQSVGLGSVSALSLPGVKVTGLTYSWQIYNNLTSSGDTRGNLIGGISLTNKSNTTVENLSFDYSLEDTGAAFKLFSNTVAFESQYSASSLDRLIVSFTGNDKNWWAGYYGPRVREVNIGLNYTGGGSSGGGSGGSPTVPTSAVAVPKVSTTTTATDATKTNYTAVNVGGVEMSGGEIAPIDNVPQVIKDANTFVRAANELEEKEKQKQSARLTLKPSEAVIPVRKLQPDTLAFVAPVSNQSNVAAQDSLGLQVKSVSSVSKRKIELELDDPTSNSNSSSLQTGLGLGPTNLLNMTMNTQTTDNSAASSATSTVKRNVANNELAGGIDLTKMAVQPVGFNTYLNLTLTDASFYAPKEAYPNQRVVDNARAQRLLQGASDRLHQEMVNSQYK